MIKEIRLKSEIPSENEKESDRNGKKKELSKLNLTVNEMVELVVE